MLHDSSDDFGPLANTWGSQPKPLADWNALIDPDSVKTSRGIGSGNLHRKGPNFIPVDEQVIISQRLKKGVSTKANPPLNKSAPKSQESFSRQLKSPKKHTQSSSTQNFGKANNLPLTSSGSKERNKDYEGEKTRNIVSLGGLSPNNPRQPDNQSKNSIPKSTTVRSPARGKTSNSNNPWLNTALSEEYFWGIKAATENSPTDIATGTPSSSTPPNTKNTFNRNQQLREQGEQTVYSPMPQTQKQPGPFSRPFNYSNNSLSKASPVSGESQTVFSRSSPAINPDSQTVYSRSSSNFSTRSETIFSRPPGPDSNISSVKPIQKILYPAGTTAGTEDSDSGLSRYSNPNRQKYSRPAGSYAPVPSNYQLKQGPHPPLRVAPPSLADNPIIIKINIDIGKKNPVSVNIRLLDDPVVLAERFIKTHKITSSSAFQLIENLLTSQKEIAMKGRDVSHR